MAVVTLSYKRNAIRVLWPCASVCNETNEFEVDVYTIFIYLFIFFRPFSRGRQNVSNDIYAHFVWLFFFFHVPFHLLLETAAPDLIEILISMDCTMPYSVRSMHTPLQAANPKRMNGMRLNIVRMLWISSLNIHLKQAEMREKSKSIHCSCVYILPLINGSDFFFFFFSLLLYFIDSDSLLQYVFPLCCVGWTPLLVRTNYFCYRILFSYRFVRRCRRQLTHWWANTCASGMWIVFASEPRRFFNYELFIFNHVRYAWRIFGCNERALGHENYHRSRNRKKKKRNSGFTWDWVSAKWNEQTSVPNSGPNHPSIKNENWFLSLHDKQDAAVAVPEHQNENVIKFQHPEWLHPSTTASSDANTTAPNAR